jgi:glycosyltransferase involved in cell wall biosynthesis
MAAVVAELLAQNARVDDGARLRVVDSGGVGAQGWRRLLTFAACLGTVARDRADVAHLHVASRGSTWRKVVVAAVWRLRRRPYVIHLHGAGYAGFLDATSDRGRSVVRWLFRGAAFVVVLGESWARLVIERLAVPADRVRVIHNGVAGSSSKPPRSAPGGHAVFLGEVGRRKGVPDLLHAFATIDTADVRLTVAGPPGEPEVVQEVREAARSDSRIRYQESLPREQAQTLLREADVLVLPSYAEGLPMVLVEAMAAGVPVVTTPVGSISELVAHGRNGYLHEPGDVDALAVHLSELLADRARRDRMGQAARETWAAGFDAADMYAELCQLWRRAAGIHPKR